MSRTASLGVGRSLERPALGLARRRRTASASASRSGWALPEIVGRLLAARGVGIEAAEHFLEPTLRALLPDPSRAASTWTGGRARLAYAVQRGETVGVFGDYDVDGACSGALHASRCCGELGCAVLHHVPDRMTRRLRPERPGAAFARACAARR